VDRRVPGQAACASRPGVRRVVAQQTCKVVGWPGFQRVSRCTPEGPADVAAMLDPTVRLNTALEGCYRVERQLFQAPAKLSFIPWIASRVPN